jgi:hypothetical protein
VFYASKTSDGDWTSPANITLSGPGAHPVSIIAVPDGSIIVAFTDNVDLLVTSKLSSGYWTPPTSIFSHAGTDSGASTATPDGAIHMVATTSVLVPPLLPKGIYYLHKPKNGAWSSPETAVLSGSATDFLPSIAVGPDGQVHMLFQRWGDQLEPARYELYYTSRSKSGAWSAPEQLTNIASEFGSLMHPGAGASTLPIVVTDDAVHFLWQQGFLSSFSSWEIMYGRLLTNQRPEAAAGGPYTAAEGGSAVTMASGSDPDDGLLTYRWDLDNNGLYETPGHSATFSAAGLDGPSSHLISVQVTDSGGLSATDQTTVQVLNVAPTAGAITASLDPVQVNTTIHSSAGFTDPGALDTHEAIWEWGDGSTSVGAVTEGEGSGAVSGSHAYTVAGVYTVKLTVTDDDGGSGEALFEYVVVYDPAVGFVTGGGWINSPAGAYMADPSLTGKANFGFVSKYQRGATVPTGQTQFQFRVADLNFHSTSYQWLVIAGAKAQYKGTGTINGTGGYSFMLTAIDGQLGGDAGMDRFRIKIWSQTTDEVIYDNQLGAPDTTEPSTVIQGGSIVIHK